MQGGAAGGMEHADIGHRAADDDGGDAGQTSLGRGERVAKHDIRVEAYGTTD
jgi:hypothetical protein